MTTQFHFHFASKISLSIGCSKVKNIFSIWHRVVIVEEVMEQRATRRVAPTEVFEVIELSLVVVAKEVATRIFKTDRWLPSAYEEPVT
jgi:hypothetical protein